MYVHITSRDKLTYLPVGLDVGYHQVKLAWQGDPITFPSLVGTADLSRFSAATNGASRVVLYQDQPYLYGNDALDLSRLAQRREDRGWIHTDEYQVLVRAALSEVLCSDPLPITLVTGLPLAYFEDRASLRSLFAALSGSTLKWKLAGRSHQAELSIQSVAVVPQPFGTLFCLALDPIGQPVDPDLLTSQVGIIDVGGKTTNVLVASRGREVVRSSTSIPIGGWDVVRSTRSRLGEVCADLDLRDHELAHAIAQRSIRYYGSKIDLSSIVSEVAEGLLGSITSAASQLWGSGSSLSTIIISGGGAHLIGEALKVHFHLHSDVRIAPDPQLANALGYYKYAQFLQRNRGI